MLTNAVRYGTDAPSIAQQKGVFVVKNSVSDSSSIDPVRLFDRFYRADAARGGGGSGLGLAIVAQLCSRMGGSASAHRRRHA
ncbi:MAG: ATP-binding protein [Eggerthellaceae bacterium]